jgi:hypothetical protein
VLVSIMNYRAAEGCVGSLLARRIGTDWQTTAWSDTKIWLDMDRTVSGGTKIAGLT